MKAVIFAAAVFVVVTAAVVFNTFYIANITETLIEYASALPEIEPESGVIETDENYAALLYMWEKHKFAVCLTVSHDESDNITELIAETAAYFNTKEAPEYERSRQLLKLALQRLRHAEAISLEGIL